MPSAITEHLDYMRQRGLAESTIDKRRRVLARLSAAIGVPLCEATPELLAAWRSGLSAGNDAIAADLSHVRMFYRWLAAADILTPDPALGLVVPRRSLRLPRPVSETDLLAALTAAPPRIRPWLVLAGWCGLRAKEIALLRRENVMETARPAPVLLIASDATKGRRERFVPMSDFVLGELVPVLPASGWVFRRQDGRYGPNAPSLVSGLANRYLHDCGLAVTIHQWRHRFGTAAYAASKDLRVVQELMGHAHPSTTAGYAAFSRADAIAAVRALPVPLTAYASGRDDVPGVATGG